MDGAIYTAETNLWHPLMSGLTVDNTVLASTVSAAGAAADADAAKTANNAHAMAILLVSAEPTSGTPPPCCALGAMADSVEMTRRPPLPQQLAAPGKRESV